MLLVWQKNPPHIPSRCLVRQSLVKRRKLFLPGTKPLKTAAVSVVRTRFEKAKACRRRQRSGWRQAAQNVLKSRLLKKERPVAKPQGTC
jgi:hypothetical protein